MKVLVDQDTCIGCGMCIDVCPQGFEYNSDDKSSPKSSEVGEDIKDKIIEARDVCPVDAIKVE